MATSGDDTFSQTADEICSDALAGVGAIGPGDTAKGKMLTHARRVLNRIVKSIDAEGKFLWRVNRADITTTASTASYTLGATIFAVDNEMNFRESGSADRQLITRITKRDYMQIPDRTEESRAPTLFYVEKALVSTGQEQLTVYFWPVPSTSSDSIEYASYTRGEDFDAGSNTGDFPSSWIQCFVYGLQAELAPAYKQGKEQRRFYELFLAEKDRMLNSDNDGGDLIMVPFGDFAGYV